MRTFWLSALVAATAVTPAIAQEYQLLSFDSSSGSLSVMDTAIGQKVIYLGRFSYWVPESSGGGETYTYSKFLIGTPVGAKQWQSQQIMSRIPGLPDTSEALSFISGSPANGGSLDNLAVGTIFLAGNLNSYAVFSWRDYRGFSPIEAITEIPSAATGVSRDATTIIGNIYSAGANNRVAVKWTTKGEPTLLGLLPGTTSSTARGVSADGSVIVGRRRADSKLFRLPYP
jgi:hypothetical protein